MPEIRRMETFPMERFDCQVAMASKIAVKRKPTASKHTLYTVCLLYTSDAADESRYV